jgi:bacillolysin
MNVLLKRAAISILLVFAFVLISNAAERPQSVKVADDPVLSNKIPSDAQLGALKSLGRDVKIDWNKENATPIFLYGNLSSTKSASSTEAAAIQFLSANSVLFKLKNPTSELKVHSQEGDELGYTHIKYDQQVNGVPVWGSQLGVHINSSGEIYCVSGNHHPTIEISTAPAVLEQNAKQVAMDDLKKAENRPIDSRATLVVFPWKEKYYLCWNVEVFGAQPNDIDWQYFVDAVTGDVVFKYNDIKYDGPVVGSGVSQDGTSKALKTYLSGGSYYMIDATKPMYVSPISNHKGTIETYDADGDSIENPSFAAYYITDINGDNVFNESSRYPAAVDLHRNLGIVYDYYYSTFGRNSWDGLGSTVIGIVHYGTSYDNAFWSPAAKALFFGDGASLLYRPTYGIDWIAHEFTHGVSGSSANFVYLGQSGALSESFSDVMACMLDSTDWYFAEDITVPSPGYLRNLQNPHLGANPLLPFGNQPMVMSEYLDLSYSIDNGGVHFNCGIPNHAAYLVASQIGRAKTARIYYRALTSYLYPTCNFLNAYYAVWLSANDFYGAGAERAAVEYAFDSVGIAPGATDWNLRNDDGSPEFVTWWAEANRGLSGEFYLPGNTRVETISYYITADHAGGSGNFDIKLFADSLGKPRGSAQFSVHTNIISSLGGWITFDLSSSDIRFSNKMYVAMFYDGVDQPQLGKDTTSSWQSWYHNGVVWVSDSAVYFIRAKVSTVTDAGDEVTMVLPSAFALDQNYPNPFNNSTLITYSIPRPLPVRFEVLNILGQVVTSKELGLKQPGVYSQSWDGVDGSGKTVPSGVYFYRVRAGDFVQTKKMVLLK